MKKKEDSQEQLEFRQGLLFLLKKQELLILKNKDTRINRDILAINQCIEKSCISSSERTINYQLLPATIREEFKANLNSS